MKLSKALIAASLLAAAPAWGGGYLGGAIVTTGADGESEDELDAGVGAAGFFGYRWRMPVPLFVEADYTDSGDLDIDNSSDSLRFRGPAVFAGAYVPLDPRDRFRLWGKLGYASIDSLIQGDSFPDDTFVGERNDSFVWAVGGDFQVASFLALRAEYRQYDGMFEEVSRGRPPGSPDLELKLQTLRVGVLLQFGAATAPARATPAPSHASPPPLAAPGAAPAYTPPPPPPAAAPQTTPMFEPTAQPLATNMARTQVSTGLQDRPVAGDPATAVIPAGTLVQVQARVSNAQGKWCFVGYDGKTGWVRAEALGG